MNTYLIKQINTTQQKMGAYISLLDFRYRNLCVKAEPASLLPVTVETGGGELNLEEVASVAIPDDYQIAVIPNIQNYLSTIMRAIFDAHPEFKLEVKDLNEDEEKKDDEEPEKYLLYTMPEVDKDRRDFLNNGVKGLHKECKIRIDAEYAAGQTRFLEAQPYSSEKDMKQAADDLKDILDECKDKADEMLQLKLEEIEEAYQRYLEKQAEEAEANPGFDVTQSMRLSNDE